MAGGKWLVLIGPLRSLLIAGQDLVCIGRPGNRSSARIEMTASVFMLGKLGFDCGQKRQILALFLANPVKQSWLQGGDLFAVWAATATHHGFAR
jgi:hypothetical protein